MKEFGQKIIVPAIGENACRLDAWGRDKENNFLAPEKNNKG